MSKAHYLPLNPIRYHLKEKAIGRLLVKVMKINKDSDDGYTLLNWKQPGASRSAGDFALRCYGTPHQEEIDLPTNPTR